MKIRKTICIVEQLFEDQRPVGRPSRKAAAVAVIENPFAGTHQDDLSVLMKEYGGALGTMLAEMALKALEVPAEQVESFGKAAIVGLNGEQEHGSALIHGLGDPSLGFNVRKTIGGGKAIIRSIEKKSGPGATVDVPLCYRFAESVCSHYDSMEVRLTDAPGGNEIAVIVVLTNCGRPHARIVGLAKEQAKGQDGLR